MVREKLSIEKPDQNVLISLGLYKNDKYNVAADLAGGSIQIAMFHDRIEISSPGGLPQGMTRDHYLNNFISIPRNPILAGVFFRLDLIELFGTGIVRIKEAYASYTVKPRFTIDQTHIHILLPVIPVAGILSDADMILNYLSEHDEISRAMAEKVTSKSKAQVHALLIKLVEENEIIKIGSGPATRYLLSP